MNTLVSVSLILGDSTNERGNVESAISMETSRYVPGSLLIN